MAGGTIGGSTWPARGMYQKFQSASVVVTGGRQNVRGTPHCASSSPLGHVHSRKCPSCVSARSWRASVITPPPGTAPIHANTSTNPGYNAVTDADHEVSSDVAAPSHQNSLDAVSTLPPPRQAHHSPKEARATLHRLIPRLFTSAGWARAHALSAGALQFYAVPHSVWLWWLASHGTILNPSGAEVVTVIALSYVKDVTAVPLALRHRRGAEREAMIIAAFVDAAVWSFTLYLCSPLITASTGLAAPPLPPAARAAIFGTLLLGGVVSTIRPFLTAADLVAATNSSGVRAAPAARERARAATEVAAGIKDVRTKPAAAALLRLILSADSATAGLYAIVQVIPGWSVILGSMTVLAGGAEMRDWLVQTLPGGYGLIYGTTFCGAAAGSLGVFSATLYSRRMISAGQLSAINAVQISVFLGFLLSVYKLDPEAVGEVMRPFWLFNELPWL